MTALGIAALALLFTWIFGGFLMRAGGLLLVFVGATVLALSSNANGILVAAIGTVLWLLGHVRGGCRVPDEGGQRVMVRNCHRCTISHVSN